MRFLKVLVMASAISSASANAAEDLAAVRAELAPTGVVRVAIGIGVSPSGFFATEDPETGEYRGVTVELGKALGEKLGLPVEFVPHQASGEIQASANVGTWDVTFMPVDDVRKQIVDFGAAYHLLQSTYLVNGDSPIRYASDANAQGVRIVGVAGTATFRASNASAPLATHISAAGQDAAIAMMLAGEADAIALGRESLNGIVGRIPGARVLESAFLSSSTAVAVPKGHPAALRYVTAFIEEAKESGFVRRAFDANGLESSVVAPIGMVP
jgi:polar amino acid transport system substrate-binding protein